MEIGSRHGLSSKAMFPRALILIGLIAGCLAAARAEPLQYVGVNLAGAEFGYPSKIPGQPGKDYTYPTLDEVSYFLGKGMNTIRLPFLWERLQPELGGGFDSEEWAMLSSFVDQVTAAGANVILDVHDYAQYVMNGTAYAIGSPQVTVEDFASFWSDLALEFKSNSKVLFGLMNEPVGTPVITTEQWAGAAQAAINAIRGVGATNTILVSGNYYSGAWSWVSGNGNGTPNAQVMGNVVDPGVEGFETKMYFEAHQYLDENYSGTSPVIAHNGVAVLEAFTEWLRLTGNMGFLGEFGVGVGEVQQAAVTEMLEYMEANSDVWAGWTWWAGGPWWPDDYFLNLNPQDGVDAPQMGYLEPFLYPVPEPRAGVLLATAGVGIFVWRSARRARRQKSA